MNKSLSVFPFNIFYNNNSTDLNEVLFQMKSKKRIHNKFFLIKKRISTKHFQNMLFYFIRMVENIFNSVTRENIFCL